MSNVYSTVDVPDEVDEDDAEAWLAWTPDLVQKIGEGVFDNELLNLWTAIISRVSNESILKHIIRVSVNRAAVLGFVPSTNGAAAPEPVSASAPVKLAPSPYRGGIIGENGVPMIPSSALGTGTITVGSANYRKSRIENGVFRLKQPKGDVKWFLNDLVVQVIGVGHKNIKVRFLGDPMLTHPTSYQLRNIWNKMQNDAEQYISLPIEWIAHALEPR